MKERLAVLTLFTLTAMLALAAFGFTVMSHADGTIGDCTGSGAGECPILAFTHVLAHIHAFQSYSTAVAAAALVLALALGLPVLRDRWLAWIRSLHRRFFRARPPRWSAPARLELLRWFSRYEKRDPSLALAVNR